jgi:hypothetical protein
MTAGGGKRCFGLLKNAHPVNSNRVAMRSAFLSAAIWLAAGGGLAWANLDSGGGRAMVGNLLAHASVGSPFATSAVTAGVVDVIYPMTPESGENTDGGNGGGGNGGGSSSPGISGGTGSGDARSAKKPGKKSGAKKADSEASSAKKSGGSKKSAEKSSSKKSQDSKGNKSKSKSNKKSK